MDSASDSPTGGGLPPPLSECPRCGCTLDRLRARFGAVPRFGAYVTDSTGAELLQREYTTIERVLKGFERRFPQSRFSFFVTKLPASWSLREYAFWLLNECKFVPPERCLGANFSLLLVYDLAKKRACLMTGYGLEAYLEREDLEAILRVGSSQIARQKYVAALRRIVAQTSKLLTRRVAQPVKEFAGQPRDIPSAGGLIPREATE